jgi:hypothetical protein
MGKRKEFVLAYRRRHRPSLITPSGHAYIEGTHDRHNRLRGFRVPTRWTAVLGADGRRVDARVPYDDSGRPQLTAGWTPAPPRALPPATAAPPDDVAPVSREVFEAQLQAFQVRPIDGATELPADPRDERLQREAAAWMAMHKSLGDLRQAIAATSIETNDARTPDDAHAQKVRQQIAEWRAAEEARARLPDVAPAAPRTHRPADESPPRPRLVKRQRPPRDGGGAA